MEFSGVAKAFDRHQETAYEVLCDSARRHPETITETRRTQLLDALNRLHLPNIDFHNNAHVKLVRTTEDPIPFIPYKASKFVRNIVISDGCGQIESVPHQVHNGQGIGMLARSLAMEGENDGKSRMYSYAISEVTPKHKRETHRTIGTNLLHELTHVNQNFRKPSTDPKPGKLSRKPIPRRYDTGCIIRDETETYWQQFYMLDENMQEQIKKQSERISNRILDDKRLEVGTNVFAMMKSFIDLGILRADHDPHQSVMDAVVKARVVI